MLLLRSSDFDFYHQDCLTYFDQTWIKWYKVTQAIMVCNNLVTVTYFLWSSDFGLYLQGHFTVFDQTWFIGSERCRQSWPMLIWPISSMLFLRSSDFGLLVLIMVTEKHEVLIHAMLIRS